MKKNPSTRKKAQPSQKSLASYLMSGKKKACKVCTLPPAVLRQISTRNPHTAPMSVVLEWLKTEWGLDITFQEYMRHNKEGHTWRKTAVRHGR